jgi:serine/threonine protein kinase
VVALGTFLGQGVEFTCPSLFSILSLISAPALGPFGRRALLVKRRVDGKQLVVKQLPIHELSETDQTSAHQEVMVLSMLQHPSIIAYHDSFLENDVLNIVLDYADAGDLHDLIARAQQQPVGQQLLDEMFILDMFVQITLGIEHIHEKKILHRVWCQLPVPFSHRVHRIFRSLCCVW